MSFSKITQLIRSIILVNNPKEVSTLLDNLYLRKKTTIVSFINAHAINLCFSKKNYSDILLSSSDILLRDGLGMAILLRSLKKHQGLNMNGTDLIPKIIERFKGKNIVLIGTLDPFVTNASQKLRENGHNIVYASDGFKSDEFYLEMLESRNPDLIVLGMGMPRQEILSAYLKKRLEKNVIIVNGGAIIDFIGGKFKRAPLWIREWHLEWLYRFSLEPIRLFKRYVIGNLQFLKRVSMIRRYYFNPLPIPELKFEEVDSKPIMELTN